MKSFFASTCTALALALASACSEDPGAATKDAGRDAVAQVDDGGVDATTDATGSPDATLDAATDGTPTADVTPPPADVTTDAQAVKDATTDAQTDGQPPPTDGSPPTDGQPTQNTFGFVYNNIIATKCTTCHNSPTHQSGLDMSTKTKAYAALVGVNAAGSACGALGATGLKRVNANSPSTSLIHMKISGTQPCGVSMPFGMALLPQGDRDTVAAWITAGAKDN